MHKVLKAAVVAVSGAAMTMSVTVAAEVPASAASGCKTTFTRYATVSKGSHGSLPKAAQCLLHSAGYGVRVDGSFSAADSAQLKKFQRRHHLSPTGSVNARSWTALLSRGSTPRLHFGKRSSAVSRLQRSLTASGRYVPATGYFGSITRNAVKSVQRSQHFRVTGAVNDAVWRTLQAGQAVRTAPRHVAKKPAVRKVAAAATGSRGARALAFAKRQLGDRYVFGASGPSSWDCSGLTRGAWRAAGVSLPHSARLQYHRGRYVSKRNLRPGDLVFFYRGPSHVAIYAGGGKVIHAPRPGKRVTYIKMSYMPYKGARRPG